MNDEATPIYWQEIDQMTQGAQFILRELGARPSVGWHVVGGELAFSHSFFFYLFPPIKACVLHVLGINI